MDRSYRDNPFEARQSGSSNLDRYNEDAELPAGRIYSTAGIPPSTGRDYNIPRGNTPTTPYLPVIGHTPPVAADSTDDIAAGSYAPRRAGLGYGMTSDYSREEGNFRAGSHEPKLGAYTPGSRWLEPQPPKSNRKKWIAIGIIVAVAGIIIIAVVVGVVVGKNKQSNNKNLSSKTTTSASTNTTVKQTDPNDPSSFTKDPALFQSLYGIAYTPVGSQLPDCGNSLAAVIQDIQIMSQLTPRIRLYGADCNQSALVLEAIKQTKVNVTVYLGNYPVPTDNGAAYTRQRDLIQAAIQTYGTEHIGGITVGNEFMLNYVTQNGIGDVNSAAANVGASILLANIQDTQSMLQTMGVNLPVGNADAGSYFSNEVLAAVNYGMANVHPWFANVSAQTSADWTANFFQEQDASLAKTLPNIPTMYIAETGWPTKSSDAGNESNGPSTASIANLQIFLNTFVCQANANGTGYFFFEFADEDWKDKQFGGVEGWWGLFNQDRSLKQGITIPTCQTP